MASGLKTLLLKLYGVWLLADLIVTIFSLLWVASTGGFEDIFVELLMTGIIGSLPLPFNIIVSWSINPVPSIIQTMLFFILLGVFLYRDSDFLD
jgi:hypothetical protein